METTKQWTTPKMTPVTESETRANRGDIPVRNGVSNGSIVG
jgi:hypothetical protein